MNKRIILALAYLIIFSSPSFAEKAPVCITPSQMISTQHDEIQIGDWVEFQVVNDVYLSDKLYIKRDTPLIGVVDFVHPNGWAKDSAEISFKKFYTVDVANQKVEILSPLIINDKTILEDNLKQIIINDVKSCIRGSELYIEPDTKSFNIFLTR